MLWSGPGGPEGIGHTQSLYLHLPCGLHKHPHLHTDTQTHWRDGLFASKACPLSIKRYMVWPQKQATAQACMASASQLLEPRHGAEGGAWGWDKLFYPWSLPRRGDRTGLEPQLSIADNIHMCWMCFGKMLLLGGLSVSVCVKWEHDAGVQKFGCLLK